MQGTKETTTVAAKGNGARSGAAIASRPAGTAGWPAGHPLTVMRRYAEEMDRMLEEFGVGMGFHFPGFLSRGHELVRRGTGMVPAQWSPWIDVLEREGNLVIRADLPGLTKDEVKIEVSDHLLTIHGERASEKKDERVGSLYNERRYGSFYRAIPLPEGAEPGKATAEFRNGVLEITMPLPKHAEKKPHRVEIREGK